MKRRTFVTGMAATFAGTALPRISTSNVEPSFASAAGM